MSLVVTLGGNPNCGKTTLFNALTGARQRVGNYPGVTVEKREGDVTQNGTRVRIVDLPGTYSLTAYSDEERVARNVIIEERPECVIDVVDATNLERNLYLSVQLMELGVPVVLALNMMDEIRKSGRHIDTEKLSGRLGVPVVETVARKGEGKEELVATAIALSKKDAKDKAWKPIQISYGNDIDPVLEEMTAIIKKHSNLTTKYPARWLALKFIEGDKEIRRICHQDEALGRELTIRSDRLASHLRNMHDLHPESVVADYRYGFINGLTKDVVHKTEGDLESRAKMTDTIDKVVTHKVFGPLLMLALFYGMFWVTFEIGAIPQGWVEDFFAWLGETTWNAMPDSLLRSLVVSGVIDGVGGVMGFVPLIIVMFLMVTFLEDAGYMARMAYMLDRIFKIFGLHGASVMPFVISGGIPGGCAVPGIMATRTLKSKKERIATVLTAPYLACGAKIPVFVLICSAFFADNAATALMLTTIAGWVFALLISRMLRSTFISGRSTPFVMELPPYRMPTVQGVLLHTWERAWQYIKKAGTVLLAVSILIWVTMTFPGLSEDRVAYYEAERAQVTASVAGAEQEEAIVAIDNLEAQEALRASAAGRLGQALEPVSKLAGFDWRTNIALIGGFAAKEVIVASLGTAYSLGEVDPEAADSLSDRLAKDPGFTMAAAVALMLFVLLYAPCVVTTITIAKEAGWNWAFFSMGFNTVLAYVVAVIGFNVTNLFF